MYNHAPSDYICPVCLLIKGNDNPLSKQADIVYKDEFIMAFICANWKVNNPGHVLIVPNQHVENIYELPVDLSNQIHAFEIDLAKAFKEVYRCDGVSSRQHNEPAGSQDTWHYHLHVFPRYRDDNLYKSPSRRSTPEERKPYADLLRGYFGYSDATTS
ncbi:HIT family protein [Paenibacillus sp. RC67]|uniref:HIT family protein n=1 Tax=Paenibacillus sp. RC67 TaxID=3039392 RepID=UPI0024ACA1EC|nr:HIT family protein [Paenibacillus sp. RC67]